MVGPYCKTTAHTKLTVQTASDVMAFLATQKAKAAKDRVNTPGKWAFVPCLNCVISAAKGTARPECHLNHGGPGCWECRLTGEDCIALPEFVDDDGCQLINMIRLRLDLPKEFEEHRQNLCVALHLGEEVNKGGEGAVTTGTPVATTPVATTPVASTPVASTPIAASPVNDKEFFTQFDDQLHEPAAHAKEVGLRLGAQIQKIDHETQETEGNIKNVNNFNNVNAQNVASPTAPVEGKAGGEESDDMPELLDFCEKEFKTISPKEQVDKLDQETVSVQVVDSLDAHDDTLRSATPLDTPVNDKEGDEGFENLPQLIDIPEEQKKLVDVENVGTETKEDQEVAKFEIGAASCITAELDVNKEGVNDFKDMPALIDAPAEDSDDDIDTPDSSVSGDVEGN